MFLLTKAKNILIHPDKFFEDLKQENSIGLALLYYTTLYSISMVFSLLLVGIPLFSLSALMPSISGYIAILFIAIYLIGILASFVVAGFLHVWAIIFGGKGSYTKTYQAYAYSVTPAFVFGWISSAVSIAMIFLELSNSYIFAFFLGLLLLIGTIGAFIYFILLLVKGIRKAHEVDTAKAALICISWIVYFTILFLLIFISLMAIASMWLAGAMADTTQHTQNILDQTNKPNLNIPTQTISISADTKDCGQDIDCFRKAMVTCEKATMASPWVIPQFFPCNYNYNCDLNQSCWHFYLCDLSFKAIDQYINASNITYRAFESGTFDNCTIELFKTESQITEAPIMNCTAPLSVYFYENFKYHLLDYCSGVALQGIDSSLMKSKENYKLLSDIFQDVEEVMLRRPNDNIQIRANIPYDFIDNVSFDDNFSEYEYVWSDGLTFDRVGPLPKEGGTYDLTVRKEVLGKRGDMEIFVYRVISADKVNLDVPSVNISIDSAYQCGSDICFEIKASDTNHIVTDMRVQGYWIHNTLKDISPWWGPGAPSAPGMSCDVTWSLVPGESCFGKILNFSCTQGTTMDVYLAGGIHASKTVDGCDSTDIF